MKVLADNNLSILMNEVRHGNKDAFGKVYQDIKITLTCGDTLEISGSNAYPALWSEFKRIIRPYFKEAGLKL